MKATSVFTEQEAVKAEAKVPGPKVPGQRPDASRAGAQSPAASAASGRGEKATKNGSGHEAEGTRPAA